MSNPPPEDRLVDHLEALARNEDRATLALLRSTLQEGRALEGLRVVMPYITRSAADQRQREDDALLVAGLFALHPESGSRSLASALRSVAQESDSVELRFRALLTAGRDELPTHLRHAVTLVASKKLAIDWRNLRTTVRFWERSDDRARRAWARDFWADGEEETTADTPTDTASTTA